MKTSITRPTLLLLRILLRVITEDNSAEWEQRRALLLQDATEEDIIAIIEFSTWFTPDELTRLHRERKEHGETKRD